MHYRSKVADRNIIYLEKAFPRHFNTYKGILFNIWKGEGLILKLHRLFIISFKTYQTKIPLVTCNEIVFSYLSFTINKWINWSDKVRKINITVMYISTLDIKKTTKSFLFGIWHHHDYFVQCVKFFYVAQGFNRSIN